MTKIEVGGSGIDFVCIIIMNNGMETSNEQRTEDL